MLPSPAWAGNRLALALAALRDQGASPPRPVSVVPPLRPHLARLAQPDAALPEFMAREFLDLLGPLDWAHFQERQSNHPWPGPTPAARGFNIERCLPSRRQFDRVLRELDNAAGQFLLDATVKLIAGELPSDVNPAPGSGATFGDLVTGDTKHILAWVKENNPKQYVADRYNKT